jgi:hypothetical protein
MKRVTLKMPTFGFIVATRAALAFGAGLLVSKNIPEQRRRALGLTLLVIGVVSTVPAVASVVSHVSD